MGMILLAALGIFAAVILVRTLRFTPPMIEESSPVLVPLPQPLACLSSPSGSAMLATLSTSYKRNRLMSAFSDKLTSLSTVSSSSSMLCCMSESLAFVWLDSIPLYVYPILLVCPSIE